MWLLSCDRRTFECPACDHVVDIIVEYDASEPAPPKGGRIEPARQIH